MNPEKLARIINLKVYTTQWYCYEPTASHKVISSNPLIIENFPEKNSTLNCYFGQIPESVINLKYSIDGFGLKKKKEMMYYFSQKKKKEFVLEDCISEIKSNPDYLPRYTWATTIMIEKKINPREFGILDENGKINTSEAYRYFREHYSQLTFSKAFDNILLSFMTEMESVLFDELLISEMALLIDDEIIVAFPKNMATQQEGFQYCDRKTINKDRISSLIQKINFPTNKWIDSIAHWRISMLIEKDPWKKFYFGFICLEILTHKIFKRIIAQNKFDVIMNRGQHFNKFVKIPFSNFIPDENECRKLPLLMKFSLIAGVLNPINHENDAADFKDCKRIRDEMSHGTYESDNPPLEKLDSLLDFYLQMTLKTIWLSSNSDEQSGTVCEEREEAGDAM